MVRYFNVNRLPATFGRCPLCLEHAESRRLEGEECPECESFSTEQISKDPTKVLGTVINFACYYKTALKAPRSTWLAALHRIWTKLETVESENLTNPKLQAATDGIWLFALCCRRIHIANGRVDKQHAQWTVIICDVLDVLLPSEQFVAF